MVKLELGVLGTSGLPRYAGYVYDEWLPNLQGPRGRKVFREMADTDPIIGAILFAIEMLCRQVDWSIQPGSDDPADIEAAAFIDDAFHDMDNTWEDTLSEITSMFTYGWSLHEIVYKRRDGKNSRIDDGKIGWQSWAGRGQETLLHWDFGPNGEILAFVQLGPPDWREHIVPMEKCLLFRTSTRRNNPEGRSILRNAWTSYFAKKHIQQIEGIGIERDLAGLPVAEVPPELLDPQANSTDKATLTAIQKIVQNIRRDEQEGIVWPMAYDPDTKQPLYSLKLLNSGGRRQFDTDAIVARYSQHMTMAAMADFIMLGHERVGSNAATQSKSKYFVLAITSWLHSICSVINDNAIPRLLALNGMSVENPPTLEHGDIERSDLDTLGNFLLHLSQAGIPLDLTPDGELVRHLMGQAKLPEPPEPEGDAVSATEPLPDDLAPLETQGKKLIDDAFAELMDSLESVPAGSNGNRNGSTG